MSSHTFGDRLYFVRHGVKGISRQQLAQKIMERVETAPIEARAELSMVTANDVRDWEKGYSEPSSTARQLVARVLGFRHELLDPDAPGQGLSPDGLLLLAKKKGWNQLQIGHVWKVARSRAVFRGEPTLEEWDAVAGALPVASQRPLFIDEFLCTHCGCWDAESHVVCPDCGNAD